MVFLRFVVICLPAHSIKVSFSHVITPCTACTAIPGTCHSTCHMVGAQLMFAAWGKGSIKWFKCVLSYRLPTQWAVQDWSRLRGKRLRLTLMMVPKLCGTYLQKVYFSYEIWLRRKRKEASGKTQLSWSSICLTSVTCFQQATFCLFIYVPKKHSVHAVWESFLSWADSMGKIKGRRLFCT